MYSLDHNTRQAALVITAQTLQGVVCTRISDAFTSRLHLHMARTLIGSSLPVPALELAMCPGVR